MNQVHPPSTHDLPAETDTSEQQDGTEEHSADHAAQAGHGHRHHGGHGGGHGEGGHGGGHGGSWLVTYCDMITLLIAFFICILTFASKESGKEQHPKLRDSILYGPGGSGPTGPAHTGSDADAIVWRQVLISAHLDAMGSRMPPLYSDPQSERTAKVIAGLAGSDLPNLGETLVLRFPLALLFDSKDQLTNAGRRALAKLANNVRQLPYDVFLQAPDQKRLRLGIAALRNLVDDDGLEPGRVGIGTRGPSDAESPTLWVTLVPRRTGG